MHIGIPKETRRETRVAATPETVKKYTGKHTVVVERGGASPPDGRGLRGRRRDPGLGRMRWGPDWLLCARLPPRNYPHPGAVVAGNPFDAEGLMRWRPPADRLRAEAAPRITRAQSLDVLSSQANLAGYKAVLLAALLRPPLSHDDDRRRHAQGRASCWARAWRACRPSPPPAPGRGGRGLRRASAAREQVESARNSSTCRSKPTRSTRSWAAMPTHAAVVDGAAGGAGVRALQAGRHHHHHRADPGPPGARWCPPRPWPA